MTIQPSLTELDARTKRGTFLVVTRSGSFYEIVASKKVSGQVSFSGGRFAQFAQPTTAVVNGPKLGQSVSEEPIIRVGQSISLPTRSYPGFTTSPVRSIYRIDHLSPEAIAEIKTAADVETMRLAEEENRQYPPVFFHTSR